MNKLTKAARKILAGILCAAFVCGGAGQYTGIIPVQATESVELENAGELISAGSTSVMEQSIQKTTHAANKTGTGSTTDKTTESITSTTKKETDNTTDKTTDNKKTDSDSKKTDNDSGDYPSGEEAPVVSSDSELIMVGGNWVTPVARYGQYVNVVLPIVNMMKGIHLNNVIVTPIVATNTGDWPFEIETSGYTQTIPDLPGIGNGQNDMDRRRELTWTFKVKDNVLNGYYKVPFLVNYIDPTTGDNVQVTLTTYVRAVGAPGVGNADEDTGKYSTPRVIVTGYDTDPKEVRAGSTFTLTLHLKNTSVNTSVSNMLVHLTTPSEGKDADTTYEAFMPSSGSNTFYVDRIGKGDTTDLSIEMKAKSDLMQKPYQLDIGMEYEDENINAYTSSSDISIQVIQKARFEFSSKEIMPSEISVGDQANVMFSIYNTGQVTLYNVHVKFEADSIESEETYLGKIESGGTGSVDTMVTGKAATEDDGTVKVIMTYEDENAETYTYEETMTLNVMDMMPMDDMGMYDDMNMEEQPQGPNKLIIILIIAAVIIVAVVVIVILLKKRRKKKENAELLDEIEKDGPEEEPDSEGLYEEDPYEEDEYYEDEEAYEEESDEDYVDDGYEIEGKDDTDEIS